MNCKNKLNFSFSFILSVPPVMQEGEDVRIGRLQLICQNGFSI